MMLMVINTGSMKETVLAPGTLKLQLHCELGKCYCSCMYVHGLTWGGVTNP